MLYFLFVTNVYSIFCQQKVETLIRYRDFGDLVVLLIVFFCSRDLLI